MVNSSKHVLIFWMFFAVPTGIYSLSHPLFEGAMKNNIYTAVTLGMTVVLIACLFISKSCMKKV